jgi:zinc protease
MKQPYGDTMLLLRPLVYQVHPYQWATIGKNIQQIQTAGLDEVESFFYRHYRPDNAILSISGPHKEDEVLEMAKRWFGDIPRGKRYLRQIPQEPLQLEQRRLVVERQVPASQIYMVFHSCGRNEQAFYTTDLLNDLLAHGESSRLKERLVKQQRLLSDVNAYVSGSIDTGMFVVTGKLHEETSPEDAEQAIWQELEELTLCPVSESELQKVKNKVEASHEFSESNLLARTMNLAYYELLGDADLLNRQTDAYFSVQGSDIRDMAESMFKKERSTVLYYLKEESGPW